MNPTNQGHRKAARFESRCTKEQKTKVQRAAVLCGTSLTDFINACLMEKADKVIKNNYVIELSVRDQLTFAGALLNPPKPNKSLLKAKDDYKKLIK